MKSDVVIYRKRYIPDEIIKLKDDVILENSDDLIVTSWKSLKPRKDMDRGVSAYFLDKGYKVSKLYDSKGDVIFWYCDIMNYYISEKVEDGNLIKEVVTEDMLLDVVVFNDGHVEVWDADEFASALESNMISKEKAVTALNNMNGLLKTIYSGQFDSVKEVINRREP